MNRVQNKDKNGYVFSFTATSLRTKELVAIARWEDRENMEALTLKIGNGKSSTGKRMLHELKKWLEVLTTDQIELLRSGTFKVQNEMAFLAVCKYYRFIREFVLEVVREKYILFDFKLTDGDYLSFFRRKSYDTPSLEELTESTKEKIKQVTFKILEQAGIIDSIRSRIIQAQLPEESSKQVIVKENEDLLQFFLFSNIEINKMNAIYG